METFNPKKIIMDDNPSSNTGPIQSSTGESVGDVVKQNDGHQPANLQACARAPSVLDALTKGGFLGNMPNSASFLGRARVDMPDFVSKSFEKLGNPLASLTGSRGLNDLLGLRDTAEAFRKSVAAPNASILEAVTAIRGSLSVPGDLTAFLESSKGRHALDTIQETTPHSKLRAEITALERRVQTQAKEIFEHSKLNEQSSQQIQQLEATVEELQGKHEIQHLLNCISDLAHEKVIADPAFRSAFENESVKAFVVSVDIRRSTELMLKARTPKLFADFITTLCGDLEEIFKTNLGVVDKFTGDGILAFFPIFYSGNDAGYLALKASKEANAAFDRRYREFRASFSTVLKDVGLGVGIDYGEVHLVRMAGALTIVGKPVVYACRLGGAPAGQILLNQPAYEEIEKNYQNFTTSEEVAISIKGDGELIVYQVKLSEKPFRCVLPDWLQEKELDQSDDSP